MAHNHQHENECCEHGHHHEHQHDADLKGQVIKIVATVVLLAAAVFVEKKCNLTTWKLLLIYLIPYFLIGFETLKEAGEGIYLTFYGGEPECVAECVYQCSHQTCCLHGNEGSEKS